MRRSLQSGARILWQQPDDEIGEPVKPSMLEAVSPRPGDTSARGGSVQTVGLIGLGNMGSGMAGNLLRAGYPLVVHDVRQAVMTEWTGRGARAPFFVLRDMDAFIRITERITKSVGIMASFAIVPLVLATCYEVLARYVFDAPTIWAYEIGYTLTGSHFLLGMAYTLAVGAHIRIDIFSGSSSTPPSWHRTCPSTCRRGTSTTSPCRATSSTRPMAPACWSAGPTGWPSRTPSCAVAARSTS